MLQVTVALPSGCSEKFSLPQSSKVGDLRVLAQKSFQRGFLRLVAADHHVLDPTVSLQAAGLVDGDHLTALVLEAKVATLGKTFALFCSGGDRVVTWGLGGDSSEVQDQLKAVQQVQATHSAFAAILADGSVVTWGAPLCGGDSSEVQDQLKGVQQVQATQEAFAAILADGSVVTWGTPGFGGDSSEVQDRLKGVQQLQATERAFAAILADGSVVTWGRPGFGGDSSEVQDQLKSVQQVQATSRAFAAILADGSVVTWGDPLCGGDSSEVQDQLKGVQQIQAAQEAFAATLADGSVVTWGEPLCGGDSSKVQDQLKGVQQVQATRCAFAAILADGSVVTWGAPDCDGDSSEVQDQLKGVQQVQATSRAFAAILADGSVVTWGDPLCGGDSSEVQDQLKGVQQIQAAQEAFAATLADGSVVTWGEPLCGGDSSKVQDQLTAVQQVQAALHAFAAILADGSVVTWGIKAFGGDSSAEGRITLPERAVNGQVRGEELCLGHAPPSPTATPGNLSQSLARKWWVLLALCSPTLLAVMYFTWVLNGCSKVPPFLSHFGLESHTRWLFSWGVLLSDGLLSIWLLHIFASQWQMQMAQGRRGVDVLLYAGFNAAGAILMVLGLVFATLAWDSHFAVHILGAFCVLMGFGIWSCAMILTSMPDWMGVTPRSLWWLHPLRFLQYFSWAGSLGALALGGFGLSLQVLPAMVLGEWTFLAESHDFVSENFREVCGEDTSRGLTTWTTVYALCQWMWVGCMHCFEPWIS
eukprot:s1970_g25.t1